MRDIRAVALDVDGVLTDGSVWWGPDGQEWKRFSYADIMGVSLGMKAGLKFALISGEDSSLVDRFAAKLGIAFVVKGCKDKARALRHFSEESGVPLAAICFMGDDVNDIDAMELSGCAASPASAQVAARRYAAFVTESAAGNGAVRELINALLDAGAGKAAA